MRLLTDFHHHALAESLLMLCEDRNGWEVWFPTGMNWFNEGYWNFERAVHGDAVARQYLLGVWDSALEMPDGTKLRQDPRHPGRVQKGIALDAALYQGWDLVLSSLPHNDEGMHRFAQQVGAKFAVQVGNHVQQSRWDLADLVLSSSTLTGFGPEWIGKRFIFEGRPTVMYHQEFSLDTFHHEWPPAERKTVASFVNCFPETDPYHTFRDLAHASADEFDWRCYGAYGSAPLDELAAGDISLVTDVANAMRAARTIWHTKWWSDGFGHVIHNAFAVGRPVVGVEGYYRDKIAGPLWREGVTSFDLEHRSSAETLDILRRLRDDDDYHRRISENAARVFRETVDFDGEADTIAALLADVL